MRLRNICAFYNGSGIVACLVALIATLQQLSRKGKRLSLASVLGEVSEHAVSFQSCVVASLRKSVRIQATETIQLDVSQ